MYALKNRVQLIGYIGSSPELKETEGGRKLAVFNIVTCESYRNAQGQRVTERQWHRVVAWGRMAELVIKHIERGKEIAVEGKLVNRCYRGNDGQKRHVTEIQVNELLMLGMKDNIDTS